MDLKECQEKQFRSLMRVRELEVIYHQVKLDRQRKAQELESSKSNQLTRQVTTFSQTEAELRSQLNIYVEKFKQVSLHMSRLWVRPLLTSGNVWNGLTLPRSRIPLTTRMICF